MNAIESEFDLNSNSDVRRSQVLSSTCHANHPYTKFSWGNRRSIIDIPSSQGVDSLPELCKFFDTHYGAQNLRVCVQGAQFRKDHGAHIGEQEVNLGHVCLPKGQIATQILRHHIGD